MYTISINITLRNIIQIILIDVKFDWCKLTINYVELDL